MYIFLGLSNARSRAVVNKTLTNWPIVRFYCTIRDAWEKITSFHRERCPPPFLTAWGGRVIVCQRSGEGAAVLPRVVADANVVFGYCIIVAGHCRVHEMCFPARSRVEGVLDIWRGGGGGGGDDRRQVEWIPKHSHCHTSARAASRVAAAMKTLIPAARLDGLPGIILNKIRRFGTPHEPHIGGRQ